MDFYEFLGDVPKEKFRMTANKLLNECFLLKCCEETKKSYYYVLNHRELYASFFDLLGYEINIIEEFFISSSCYFCRFMNIRIIFLFIF